MRMSMPATVATRADRRDRLERRDERFARRRPPAPGSWAITVTSPTTLPPRARRAKGLQAPSKVTFDHGAGRSPTVPQHLSASSRADRLGIEAVRRAARPRTAALPAHRSVPA